MHAGLAPDARLLLTQWLARWDLRALGTLDKLCSWQPGNRLRLQPAKVMGWGRSAGLHLKQARSAQLRRALGLGRSQVQRGIETRRPLARSPLGPRVALVGGHICRAACATVCEVRCLMDMPGGEPPASLLHTTLMPSLLLPGCMRSGHMLSNTWRSPPSPIRREHPLTLPVPIRRPAAQQRCLHGRLQLRGRLQQGPGQVHWYCRRHGVHAHSCCASARMSAAVSCGKTCDAWSELGIHGEPRPEIC